MPAVELVHWNPRRSILPGRFAPHSKFGRRVNNFGDLIGPHVVSLILRQNNMSIRAARTDSRLLSVGSTLHFAKDGDVVWGTGRNGKMPDSWHEFRSLDVRAVRGPLTMDFLRSRSIEVPEIFGDPALLLPTLDPSLRAIADDPKHDLTIVPNLNDLALYPPSKDLLDPRRPFRVCLERIASSRLVVGSSLHGIIVAESLGIRAQPIVSVSESVFKYEDYYLGTERAMPALAGSVEEAIRLAGPPPPKFSTSALLEAFPFDLWTPS